MSKVEGYGRKYEYIINPDPEARGERIIDSKDTINRDLRNRCIDITPRDDAGYNSQFLYFDGNSLVKITINERGGHGEHYMRTVDLEILPPEAETPKELSDLLKSRGFKKLD